MTRKDWGPVASVLPLFQAIGRASLILDMQDSHSGNLAMRLKDDKGRIRMAIAAVRPAKRLEAKGIATDIKILTGDPAEAIVSFAEKNPCDLIVMASRGRSGTTRWAVGSVADKVFRASAVPVLMVKPPKPPAKKK